MDYNAPPSSSAAGDSRQKTYKVDAAVEHARNKLETRIQAGLAQGLEICEIEITKKHVPELTKTLNLRWLKDDNTQDIAVKFCVANRIDVQDYGRRVEVQMNRHIANISSEQNVSRMHPHLSPSNSRSSSGTGAPAGKTVDVITLGGLEKVLHNSRIKKASSGFRLNENRMRLVYMIHQLTKAGSDGHLYVIEKDDESCIPSVEPKSKGWVHDVNLTLFVHEAVNLCVLDYEPLPVPISAPYVGYINICNEARHDIELLRSGGYLEVVTVQNNEFLQTTIGTEMSVGNLGSSDSKLTEAKWGITRLICLTSKAHSKIKMVDLGAREEINSVLFAPLGSKDTFDEAHSAERISKRPSFDLLYRTVWHRPRCEFLLCCVDKGNGNKIILPPHTEANVKRSTITDVSAVSYVCSPWLPPSLQVRDTNGVAKAPENSNREIGQHSADIIGVALGPDKGKQERTAQDALNEVMLVAGVNGPRILLGDWIPGLHENEVLRLDNILCGRTDVGISRAGSGPAAAAVYSETHASHLTSKTSSAALYSSGHRVFSSSTNRLQRGMKDANSKNLEGATLPVSPSRRFEEGSNPAVTKSARVGLRVVEMLGTNRKSCKVAVTVEPDKPPVGNCDQAELGEFALSVSGKDGCAIYGVELESIDQHVTFVNSSADAKKLKTAGVNVNSLTRAVAQLQKRSTMVSDAMFFRGGTANEYASHDASCGIAELRQCLYGTASRRLPVECLPKYVGMIVGQMHPFMRPPMYLDGSDYEMRLSSLIGRCIECHELSPGETLILGANGFLLSGTRAGRYQDILTKYVRAKTKERVVDVLSSRIAMLEEHIFSRKYKVQETPEATLMMIESLKRITESLGSSVQLHTPVTGTSSNKTAPPSPATGLTSDSGREKLQKVLGTESLNAVLCRRVTALSSQLNWLAKNCGYHAHYNDMAKLQYLKLEELNSKLDALQYDRSKNIQKQKGGCCVIS